VFFYFPGEMVANPSILSQVEDELAKQLSQMKLMVQGTQGSFISSLRRSGIDH
jgi:hypothetical protein